MSIGVSIKFGGGILIKRGLLEVLKAERCALYSYDGGGRTPTNDTVSYPAEPVNIAP